MKQLVGLAGMLLASSASAEQPGLISVRSTMVNPEAGPTCENSSRHKPGPELVVTISPAHIKIPDNSKHGTRLATIAVSWSNGAPFTGKVSLTRNPGRICQLTGMEVQLGRDTTKADDYTTSVCTVTATE